MSRGTRVGTPEEGTRTDGSFEDSFHFLVRTRIRKEDLILVMLRQCALQRLHGSGFSSCLKGIHESTVTPRGHKTHDLKAVLREVGLVVHDQPLRRPDAVPTSSD